nr:integrase, catalytic region, zinc finger, CCHC-type, peptidase aspartic, catalytic [Tanacetum cinerariifolium]
MQTQTSNTLHNAIMKASGKDRPSMLASDKVVLISEGSPETTTKRYMETYKNVSQDIRDQLNAEAEAVQIILTGIDNDIYPTVDACPNACEMLKAIERSQQAATRNRGKAIVNSPPPIYDQEPSMVVEDDEMETVGTTVVQKSGIQCYNCKEFRHVARECQKPKRVKDAAYHREKMLLCKQEKAGIQLNAEKADWRDDTDDESEDQELEAHYMYMVPNNDNYNVFAIEYEHLEQSKSFHDTYPTEQDEHNVIIDSLDMSYDREQIDQNDDDDDDLANECELLASLIEKLKCEIDDSKNRNKFLETSNKVLVNKLKGEIEDFKNKNTSLESSNNRFKEANNKLSETNKLMYTDLKKFQAELNKCNEVKYVSKMEIDCAKDKGDLISYKMESQKSFNKYTQTINDLNQTISEKKKELCAHQETISIVSQAKEAQIKLYKTREDKELDKVIALENKVKVLDNIVYKTGQSVQTMNMLNHNYKTSFAKPEFLKKPQRANPRLYDIEIILFIVDSGCSKHMTRNLKPLINFVAKFLGTVKFRNDQIAPILGYGDLPPAAATWQLPIGQPPVTWHPRQRQPPSVNAAGHQSTAAGHGGDQRSTVAVNDGQRRRPPVNGGGQRRSTPRPPVNGGGQRRSPVANHR